MPKIFFQVGTNTGDDQFKNLVKASKPDLVVLVEPNINLIEQIKENYKDIKNVHVYNNALYYNDDDIELYIPAKNGVYGSKADNNFTYSHAHFSLLPMNDWGKKDDMVKIKTKGITFDEICKIHNITEIDLLQTDTEGFDYEIIKMIDLSKYKIKAIIFEKWAFQPECFTSHNKEIASNLGLNGLNTVLKKLKEHNYSISEINKGSDFIATLNQ